MTLTSENILKQRWFLPAAAVIGLLLVILYALGIIGGGDKVEPGTTPLKGETIGADIKTFVVAQQQMENLLAWQGTVRAKTITRIAPKLNARILDVKVRAGDSVESGQVIAVLDERSYRAAYNEANAALNAAKANANLAHTDATRIKDLFNKEAATKENLDTLMARASATQAMVNQAASVVEQTKVNLGENVLRAPYTGIITERLKEPGDMGTPNEPVVIMYKSDELRFEANIPSGCLKQIELNKPVTIRLDQNNQKIDGKISEISPEIDQQTRSQLIKADLPQSSSLKQGLFGWLDLGCNGGQQALYVPATAILHFGQLEAVKVVKDREITTRHVRTGKRYGESVEILSGLQEGETIVNDVSMR